MSASDRPRWSNLLLQALSPDDLALLEPVWERVTLDKDQTLVARGEPIAHVHFLGGGIASIVSPSENGVTEVGIVGREGVTGTPVLLGTDRSAHRTFVQVDGTDATRVGAADFARAMDASVTLRRTMLRYVQTLLTQTAQSAVANARYQIEARLARWLVMCQDRVQRDDIALTHEFMAMMIGSQRSGVTLALHVLEGTGMIRSKRGVVVVRDRDRLVELAGDSYGAAEAEYRRLIAPFDTSAAAR